MTTSDWIALLLGVGQIVIVLPLWKQWRELNALPQRVDLLEKRVEELETKYEEEIKDVKLEMKTLTQATYKANLAFTEILGEVKGTLKGLTVTIDSLNKTLQEYKEETKDAIGELKQKINGLK